MRARVFLALLLTASLANAAEIVVKYKAPYYLDDIIPFSILIPSGGTARQIEQPSNLAIEEGRAIIVGPMVQQWFVARPLAGGPARIPSFAVVTARGEEIAPAVTFDVLPVNITDNPDEALVLRKLRESGRPPVIGRVIVRPQQAYAGELVQIIWVTIADVQTRMIMRDKPKIEGAIDLAIDPSDAIDLSAGSLEHRTEVRRVVFVPDQPGRVDVPAAKLEGEYFANGTNELVTRMTPRQPVTVLPVPGGLPPGKYTLNASKVKSEGDVARLVVDITGPGDAGTAHPPSFGDLNIPYLLKPRPMKLVSDAPLQQPLLATRTWDIEFHPGNREVDLPPIRFTSWDRDQQRPVTIEERIDGGVPAKSDPRHASPEAINGALMAFGIVDLLLLIALLVTNSICSI